MTANRIVGCKPIIKVMESMLSFRRVDSPRSCINQIPLPQISIIIMMLPVATVISIKGSHCSLLKSYKKAPPTPAMPVR